MLMLKKHAYMCMMLVTIVLAARLWNTHTSYMISGIVCWAVGVWYSVQSLRNRFTLFAFNLGFFIFLMGGYILHWIQNQDFRYFSNHYNSVRHTLFCIQITLFTINFFYILFGEVLSSNDWEDDQNEDTIVIKQNGLIIQGIYVLLIFSFICELLVEIRTTSYILSTSYALSESVLTGLPTIITSFASYYYISLFLYWATFPGKRGMILSLSSLALIELIILRSGERGEPISLFLTALFYILVRNKKGIYDLVISKRLVIILIIFVPFFIAGMQKLSYSRVNKEYNENMITSVTDFFDSQGGSAKIIANGYDLKDRITEIGGHTYVLGTVRKYLRSNIFTRMILGTTKSKRSVSDAYSGDSFLATYGYLHSEVTYKKGVGGGSTYIAEVFQDGGYILLFLFNAVLAFLLFRIDTYHFESIIGTAILLNVFRYMPLLPRGVALQWLTSTFAIQNIILFMGIWFVNKCLKD